MPDNAKRVEQALARARDVAVELVRQGRLEEAVRLTLDAVREAMAPLAASVAQLTTARRACESRGREVK